MKFKSYLYYTLTSLLFMSGNVYAENFLPSNLLQLDNRFSHHVLLVEKSTHSLFLYQNENGFPKLVKTYKVATGKLKGNKFNEGDHKTPEGIYQFQEFRPKDTLLKQFGNAGIIYGAGAFTTNYPNIMDRRNKKSGGGIWLHSTDDDNRIEKGLDSRGCVVTKDADIKDISQYIDLSNTSVIIVQNINFHRESNWKKNKDEISDFINQWASSWANKDFKTYIDSYSETFFDNAKGGKSSYGQYKKAVFSRADKPLISFSNISILAIDDYAVVTLEQKYQSAIINDTGKKTLYLKKDQHYQWKIESENFHKISEETVAFKPEMRYFTQNIKEN